MAVFASRQIVLPVVPPSTITVTITGKGHATYCYAIINGATQYSAGTHEVNTGDTITFGVYGIPISGYRGSVTIDGTQVLEVTKETTQTYDWAVPNGISTVEIAMSYNSTPRYGKITVTTA